MNNFYLCPPLKKMEDYYLTEPRPERVILVGIINQNQKEQEIEEYLDELAFLAETAGGIAVEKFTQKLETPNPRTFIGTGKLHEIEYFVKTREIDTVIFDDELTPSQLKNIEKVLACKIL